MVLADAFHCYADGMRANQHTGCTINDRDNGGKNRSDDDDDDYR